VVLFLGADQTTAGRSRKALNEESPGITEQGAG